MTRVKIYGAGSIGNHLAHAARRMGWDVVVCDVSAQALERMRTQIYPQRYGRWDEAIQLVQNEQAPKGGFDLIGIGTPPEWHLPLALEALREHPKAILIEKPLCPPSLHLARELTDQLRGSDTRVFVGYDHVVGKAARAAEALLRSGVIGTIKTLDVEFREHWAGIFKAHPWLSGPQETYLGYWEAGGGASGEHSHALNLWQHFARVAGAGRVVNVDARLTYARAGKAWYDELCLLTLQTEDGLVGRVVQDVVTLPPRKWARIQGAGGAIEWANHGPTEDVVRLLRPGRPEDVQVIQKTRPDDFIEELTHVQSHWSQPAGRSPIAVERGLDTMRVLAAAHRSAADARRVQVDEGPDAATEGLAASGTLRGQQRP